MGSNIITMQVSWRVAWFFAGHNWQTLSARANVKHICFFLRHGATTCRRTRSLPLGAHRPCTSKNMTRSEQSCCCWMYYPWQILTVLQKKWCAMDPINLLYPIYVSIYTSTSRIRHGLCLFVLIMRFPLRGIWSSPKRATKKSVTALLRPEIPQEFPSLGKPHVQGWSTAIAASCLDGHPWESHGNPGDPWRMFCWHFLTLFCCEKK